MPLLFHFANIFGKPKHFDAAASRLVSDSQLAANQAYPKLPNHPLAIRNSTSTDPTGECRPRRIRRWRQLSPCDKHQSVEIRTHLAET